MECDHRDEDVLRELYHERGLSEAQVADRCGCSASTVHRWLVRHGIVRRDGGQPEGRDHPSYVERASLSQHPEGYLVAQASGESVLIHRLACVAWYGWDEVAGDVECHHENGVPWDNRQANLTPMAQEDHRRHHAEQMHDEGRL